MRLYVEGRYFYSRWPEGLDRAGERFRSRCSRKNAHIRLVASMLRLVGPTSHSGSGPPPGQECPPPATV